MQLQTFLYKDLPEKLQSTIDRDKKNNDLQKRIDAATSPKKPLANQKRK